jgi:hypothetical protein
LVRSTDDKTLAQIPCSSPQKQPNSNTDRRDPCGRPDQLAPQQKGMSVAECVLGGSVPERFQFADTTTDMVDFIGLSHGCGWRSRHLSQAELEASRERLVNQRRGCTSRAYRSLHSYDAIGSSVWLWKRYSPRMAALGRSAPVDPGYGAPILLCPRFRRQRAGLVELRRRRCGRALLSRATVAAPRNK